MLQLHIYLLRNKIFIALMYEWIRSHHRRIDMNNPFRIYENNTNAGKRLRFAIVSAVNTWQSLRLRIGQVLLNFLHSGPPPLGLNSFSPASYNLPTPTAPRPVGSQSHYSKARHVVARYVPIVIYYTVIIRLNRILKIQFNLLNYFVRIFFLRICF